MYAHTTQAMAFAKSDDGFTGFNLDAWADDNEWSGVGMGPVGRHRESDALARSNWDVVVKDLRERFGADSVAVAHFGHWAVGWVDELTWDAGREGMAEAVAEWQTRLEVYPVADDTHFSELEWEENHPSDDECYCENKDCHVRAGISA